MLQQDVIDREEEVLGGSGLQRDGVRGFEEGARSRTRQRVRRRPAGPDRWTKSRGAEINPAEVVRLSKPGTGQNLSSLIVLGLASVSMVASVELLPTEVSIRLKHSI